MSDILKIYLMNVINDIDNILIILAVIRKYHYQIKALFIYIVISLTISRTLYIMIIHSLSDIPGLRVIIGIVMLYIAIRLAWSIKKVRKTRSIPTISTFQMLLIIIVTDFSICLDSIMITAELSSNILFIVIGIFLSISTIFIIINLFSEIIADTSWIQIIVNGLIAHVAILGIVKDPITKELLIFLEGFLEIHINNWINVFALDIVIIIMFIGLIRRIQNRTSFND
ncbi:TerC family protein [Peribacillus huizhouensis]|uniref:Tellurium resistance membrane protein TerC n=1 Tax=Peribacillus huizhouensis TaxID=1501239 RepID=A0ABR6CWM5_9BACI|nr:tellurium resistance protein TerC [Peribacillus huizhouensis]MBA9029432.1 putative tellurium resistance membrane protein TerC [Peribacillus huizhouensis]